MQINPTLLRVGAIILLFIIMESMMLLLRSVNTFTATCLVILTVLILAYIAEHSEERKKQ